MKFVYIYIVNSIERQSSFLSWEKQKKKKYGGIYLRVIALRYIRSVSLQSMCEVWYGAGEWDCFVFSFSLSFVYDVIKSKIEVVIFGLGYDTGFIANGCNVYAIAPFTDIWIRAQHPKYRNQTQLRRTQKHTHTLPPIY